MKKGKEVKITNQKNYKVVIGTVDNKNPRAVYIDLSSWANPMTDEEINYNRIIKDIDKSIRQVIYNTLTKNKITCFSSERTIVDFDLRKSGVKFGKRSYSNCEITLYLTQEISIVSDYLQDILKELIDVVIKDVLDKNRYFTFHKKKR